MTEPVATSGVGALSFEDALAQLESIVSELERGETPLEQTIDRFERGIALARRCEDRLNEADRKVAILLKEGTRVVEVDMESGERLGVHNDPGVEVAPQAPPPPPQRSAVPRGSAPQREPTFSSGPSMDAQDSTPPGPPPRGQRTPQSAGNPSRRPAGPPATPRDDNDPTSQMSLGQAFAIKDPSEMDDDDIPF